MLGVTLDDVTLDEAVIAIGERIKHRQPAQVVTVNAEFIMAAQRHPEFRQAINNAWMHVPDGSGPVLLSPWVGHRLRGWVSGVDLAERLVATAAEQGWRVFLLGNAAGLTPPEEAAAVWQRRYPRLVVAGCYAGTADPAERDAMTNAVKAAQADLLLVTFGAPDQDLWLSQNLTATGAIVGIGLGGTFDYVSGRRSRAPQAWRRLGLEWFHRLLTQPWRWRRMLALPQLVWKVMLYGSRPNA